jgi:autotransporter-associated beta strand protein
MALLLTPTSPANTWDGGGINSNWSTAANWDGDVLPGYGTLRFAGDLRTTNTNDTFTSMNQVNWNGGSAWVMNSTSSATLSLFDNGGTQAKLESLGGGGVTINANIVFAANNGAPPNPFGEINAVGSSFNFASGTLTVNGSSVNGIKFFGGSGQGVTFSNTVNASGKWFGITDTNGSRIIIASGANVTTGDIYVMNGGTLRIDGGTLTTSAVRLGGDFGNTGNQNQTLGGRLDLNVPTGGVTFSSTINTVSGNTSGVLQVNSGNSSGTNTITGGVFLDSDLEVQTTGGGTLAFSTGTFDIKNRNLRVVGNGTTTVSQVLSSSLAAGGWLQKSGNGTMILSNAANTYTGTNPNSLNANGTLITAGTLAIAGDGSLGLAPASAYNNIQFIGGTLRADASISLHANRNVVISQGATFDNNGNTFTINGVISNFTLLNNPTVTSKGSGITVLAGANTYTGQTIIESGTLSIDGDNRLGADPGGANFQQLVITENATLRVTSGFTMIANRGINITTTGTVGDKAVIDVVAGQTLAINGNIRKDGARLELKGGAGTVIDVNGVINGVSANSDLYINGGTTNLNAANTFNGPTDITSGTLGANVAGALGTTTGVTINSGGTLLLAGTGNRVNDSAPITLAGGTLNAAGLSETFGTLTLTANSIIDFGTGTSVLTFANSSGINWSGFTLSLYNWTGAPSFGGGSDQLRFSGNGLTPAQLGLIHFYSDAGATEISFTPTFPSNGFVGSLGEVVPVPEPSSVLVAVGMFGLIGWRERRHSSADRRAVRLALAR